MTRLEELVPGSIVMGMLPTEPITVVSTNWVGSNAIELFYKDIEGHVNNRLLYRDDEAHLEIKTTSRPWSFDAPGDLFRLVSEATRIRLAALFDPLLAVHSSLVEPLPHQIIGVYKEMLGRQPLRFLLADDPGAGKTIMAGLLIKELMARGDLERCLIVCPGSLVEQWQDELYSKFHLPFEIATNDKLEAARTGNWFLENPLTIGRLDKLSRDEDLHPKLCANQWDLVIVDEAHKMSASFYGNDVKYTKRYRLGQLLSGQTRHFLLMTATPHNGKEEDFQLFMALLDGDRFEGRPHDAVHTTDCSDMMRRLVKEQLRKFDGTPLFPERKAYTVGFELSDAEARLYKDVTEYVREEFNRAEQLESNGRKGTVGFALTVLQRRLASSPEAIYQSLRRRRERLESHHREAKILERGGKSVLLEKLKARQLSIDELEDMESGEEQSAEEREAIEEAVLDDATAARTIEELEIEIEILKRLEKSALDVRNSSVDKKWDELSKLLQDQPEMFDAAGYRRKLIIFTEHRDTLTYLKEKIGTLLGRPESIVTIVGGMGRDQRRAAEESFRQDKGVHILLATDAAGEGINLQRAHLMTNYDLPWNPNRLEQRFGRIHRIGQTEVCHCWNLVAHETREGDVYRRLLEKLENQREALGGKDAVFDVLGRLFHGTSLRQLLVEAIRYGEQPEVRARLEHAIDNATDQSNVRNLIEEDALARDSMDSRKVQQVREEMERAEARRLQPHFIEALFMDAFKRVGGQISRREPDRFEITRVPASIRSRDRQIGQRVPVLHRYERVTFKKELINVPGKPTAAFICPGHPLLDSLIDVILERYKPLLRQGVALIDPNNHGIEPRVLYYLEHSIRDSVQARDGQQHIISRQMQFVELYQDGTVRSAGSAPYLDYRPATEDELTAITPELDQPWLMDDLENKALTHAVENIVPEHLQEVREPREELIKKTLAAVQTRLKREIAHWDHRAEELKIKELAGHTTKINSIMARQRADDLEARLKNRLDLLEQQRHIFPSPPMAFGGALIIPQGLLAQYLDPDTHSDGIDQQEKQRIDRLAIQAVMTAERTLGRFPQEMPHHNEGYDIEVSDPNQPGQLCFIEVKGKTIGKPTLTISASQIRCCCNMRDQWILAIVLVDGDRIIGPKYLRAPFDQAPSFAEIGRNFNVNTLLAQAEDPS